MSGPTGILYYLIGPSGAGKDSLLAAVHRYLDTDVPVAVARRTITRPANTTGEDHRSLDRQAFREREMRREFALSWESHGHLYGIGTEVDEWLARGICVLVNGSRGALERAEHHWGKTLIPVVIRVRPELLAQRLQQRGREDPSAVQRRLDRARALGEPNHTRQVVIDNNGPLEQAAARLAALVGNRRSTCG